MRTEKSQKIAIIGGGPAGLFAAEKLSRSGFSVTIYDRKPSVGRKFLMAGRGGLNLTHSEDINSFIERYGERALALDSMIRAFPPQALRDWCEGLGQPTFIGTSGRVFPVAFKASPLMRAWITRLESQGVVFQLNHDWTGWSEDGALKFQSPNGDIHITPDATLLALGGGSWPRLGSDGSWMDILMARGGDLAPLQPSNCGFTVHWSELFRSRFAGEPLKTVVTSIDGASSPSEIMITQNGIEGGAIYALSSRIRETINAKGSATISLDLKPPLSEAEIIKRLRKPRGTNSLSNHLRKSLKLSPLAVNLLMESAGVEAVRNASPLQLAALIKNCTITLHAPFGIERAISSAGGICFSSVDDRLMLRALPGVFVAGEILDWEAPTGGYLLQACFATGAHAANGVKAYLGISQTQ